MAELEFLAGYSGQTTDELLAMAADHRVDSLVLAFEEGLRQKGAAQLLTSEERVVLAIEALEREVNNGGYDQFFINSSRESVPFIVDSLNQIGCPITAEITQAAISSLQAPNLEEETLEAIMAEENEERDDALQQCDEGYFQRRESIEDQLFKFITSNRGSIQLP